MSCSLEGTRCGHGTCVSGVCQCDAGFASLADFYILTPCQVNIDGVKGLWGLAAVIWISVTVYAVFALTQLERRTKEAFCTEAVVLSFTIIGGACNVAMACLQCTGINGSHSVGVDSLTTAFYVVGNILMWSFLALNPLSKSQTGVGSLALARIKRLRVIYLRVAPILVCLGIILSMMPVMTIYGGPEYSQPAAITFFLMSAMVLMLNASMSAYSLGVMQKDFTAALSSNATELPPSQRTMIIKVANSTRRVIYIPIFAVIILGPFLIICATPVLLPYIWATLPIMLCIKGSWMFRYVHRSVRASTIVRDKDRDKTSNYQKPTAEIETRNSSGNPEKPATDSNSSSVSSGQGKPKSLKNRPRKTFKLKGFKSKPMDFMSQVTEGNSEGTVRFTQVEGVENMNTSTSSRFSRPISLSAKLELPSSPKAGHMSVSSVHSTLWEVDINGSAETLDKANG